MPGINISIVVPKIFKRKLLRSIKYHFRRKVGPLLLEIKDKKVFNGCRPSKKVRKKRRFKHFNFPHVSTTRPFPPQWAERLKFVEFEKLLNF